MSVALQPTTATIPRWKWRNGNTCSDATRYVTFGQSGDGGWYAEHSGLDNGPFHFRDYDRAWQLAQLWLSNGDEWTATPASYDAIGHPDDGAPWTKRGGEWFPT